MLICVFLFSSISKETTTKDENDEEEKVVSLPLKSSLQCLGAAWAEASPPTQSKRGADVVTRLSKVLLGMHPWHLKVVAAETAKLFASSICADMESTATGWIQDLVPGNEVIVN